MNTWITITDNRANESKKIVSNWMGVIAFLKLNVKAEEQIEIINWVADTFEQGGAWVGWAWPNGDVVEFYYPANESLPTSVNAPVVINPLRKMDQTLVSAIL